MSLNRKPVPTAEETAAIISAAAVARGVDSAKTQIVGILGRDRSFVRIHVAITNQDLGKTTQYHNGYMVTAIFASKSAPIVEAVGKAVAAWLNACHGRRYEVEPVKSVFKPGTKTLYLAVAYAVTDAKKSGYGREA